MTVARNLGLSIAALLLVACAGDIIEPEGSWLSRTDFETQYAATVAEEDGLRIIELRSVEDDLLLATLEWADEELRGEVMVPDADTAIPIDAPEALADPDLHKGLWEAYRAAIDVTRLETRDIEPTDGDAVAGASAELSRPVGAFGRLTTHGSSPYSWTRTAFGWVFDPDRPAASIWVHFYLQSEYHGFRYIGATRAAIPRPDINTHFRISGHHGFRWTLPEAYDADGQDVGFHHRLHAYGIDVTGDRHRHIGSQVYGSKITFHRNRIRFYDVR